jgi:hypothetical protein
MPLEIKEIDISMRVRDASREPEARPAKFRQDDCHDVNREELVDDCVLRVLQILKTLGGR